MLENLRAFYTPIINALILSQFLYVYNYIKKLNILLTYLNILI
ncbi:hypothetical protein c7_L504 [Megavirus courdo7]|uniref:Uncharacterized protein n=1 Tax=Megavirus courdo7 TaxID=1128135 RepID=H2EAZ4_9VIRU|nr:hypothetical protein c7_L504 [Megavirus courdo7]